MKKLGIVCVFIVMLLIATVFSACDGSGASESSENSENKTSAAESGESTQTQESSAASEDGSSENIPEESSAPTESSEPDESSEPEESSKPAESSSPSDDTSSDTSSGGGTTAPTSVYMKNGLIVSGDRAMEPFSGGVQSMANYGSILNTFSSKLGPAVNVYCVAIPTANAFYSPSGYSDGYAAHTAAFGSLKDSLSGVTYVDVLEALKPHKDENLYLRTDFHWNALGAYYAAQELAKTAGTPFATMDAFTKESFSGYVGNFASYNKLTELYNYPEVFEYYVPKQSYTAMYYSQDYCTGGTERSLFSSAQNYAMFIYGDNNTVIIDTGLKTGRTLMVIKDSYGNALAPFLIGSFDKVIFADVRFFALDVKQFVADNGVTDVAFAMGSYAMAGSNGKKAANLIKS